MRRKLIAFLCAVFVAVVFAAPGLAARGGAGERSGSTIIAL